MEKSSERQQPSSEGEERFVTAHVPLMDQVQEEGDMYISPWAGFSCAQVVSVQASGILRCVELHLDTAEEIGMARVFIHEAPQEPMGMELGRLLARGLATPVRKGWNRFDFSDMEVALSAGCRYAIQFIPLSACDWRIRPRGPVVEGRALLQQWGDAPWEAVPDGAIATFRLIMEPFRSATRPSCRNA